MPQEPHPESDQSLQDELLRLDVATRAPLVTRRDLLRWGASGALTALFAGCYGSVGASAVQLERHTLHLPRWDADGMRVALFSDLHSIDAIAVARVQKAVRLALEEKPDLIVIPGDFLNFSEEPFIKLLLQSVEGLHEAKCPVIGTLGNHDYWTNNPRDIIDAIREKTPIKLLRNESVEFEGVTIAGLDDGLVNRHRPKFLDELDNRSLLLLFHEPDFVEEVPKHVSLQLSGHSHGGQICLPGGLHVKTPRGAWKYIRGFYPDARAPLFVTKGVGTVGIPCRSFCPPEVTLLTLRSAS